MIEIHSSWIVVNSIQGCPKSCKYCFLHAQNQAGVAPVEILNPRETIDALLQHKYYHPGIPICFFTHTDPVATHKNRTALLELLTLCKEKGIKNVKCFSTKCPFTEDFVKEIAELIKSGEKIIAYITFSGLDQTIERGVNHKRLYESLGLVKEANIPLLHFWRPFLPQNSSRESLLRVLDLMMPYAKASIVRGLKVAPDMIDYMDFWPAIQENAEKTLKAESVWPKNVLQFFQHLPEPYNQHPIYMSNSCAISYVMQTSDIGNFYGGKECKNYNRCPSEQRERCKRFYSDFKIAPNELDKLLAHVKIDKKDVTDLVFTPKPCLTIADERILTIEDIVYLRHVIHVDVNSQRKDAYWRSLSSGDEPAEIE